MCKKMDFFVLRKVGGSLLALFYADFNSTVFSQSREYNLENEKKEPFSRWKI